MAFTFLVDVWPGHGSMGLILPRSLIHSFCKQALKGGSESDRLSRSPTSQGCVTFGRGWSLSRSQFSCLQNGGGRLIAKPAFLARPEDYLHLLIESIQGYTWHCACILLFHFFNCFRHFINKDNDISGSYP